MDAGVILVDKPRGPSSHQLTAWAREMLGIQRLGHGGTLDPFATGLLTMLCGKATRLTEMVLTGDKKYIAVLKFGREVDSSELENLLNSLNGEIYNVPPLESAVKVQVRTRIIHEMRIIEDDSESNLVALTIFCNAGTYIRTLAEISDFFSILNVNLLSYTETKQSLFSIKCLYNATVNGCGISLEGT